MVDIKWLALLASGAALASAQPSAEFLEYLGQWDETDEDWIVIDSELGETREHAVTTEEDDDEDDD